jgi:tRNA(Arg) A34 adenosine deaminase TadA
MRHDRWMNLAIEVARANPNTRHKHGAILVKAGSVLAVGLNTEREGGFPSRHAEWHAVREHLDDRATLYVARITRGGEIAYSKPCKDCQRTLRLYTKVKEVFYTQCDGSFTYHSLSHAIGR